MEDQGILPRDYEEMNMEYYALYSMDMACDVNPCAALAWTWQVCSAMKR
jgi:hypothetical protein